MFGDDYHGMRVENTAGVGQPDINICIEGIDIWIESKERRGNVIKIRPSQIAWIQKRSRAGGAVYIMVLHNDTVALYNGNQARLLTDPATVDKAKKLALINRPFKWSHIIEQMRTDIPF